MIISVAMLIDGKVESLPQPNRHHDIVLKFPDDKHKHGDQGFIDDKHGFVRRRAAAMIALRQGQVKELKWPHHGLFSEDLW